MRKLVLLSAAAMVFLALGAGVVLAQEDPAAEGDRVTVKRGEVIQCKTVPCRGSGGHDLIYERKGNGKADEIIMKGGADQVRANKYTNDKDVVEGGSGFDLIYVNDGDTRDQVDGGGRSKCYVDAASEVEGGCSEVIER